eukprot:SAG31_NODE_22938_length_514_cov_42.985542_1_plen_39_part_10
MHHAAIEQPYNQNLCFVQRYRLLANTVTGQSRIEVTRPQ